MPVTSIQWEHSRNLSHTRIAHVEGVVIGLYHNPHLRPLLWSVYVNGGVPWTYRSPETAESGALRLLNITIARNKEKTMQRMPLFAHANGAPDPKEPNQLPPGELSDAVGEHDESDFNDDDENFAGDDDGDE